MDTKTKKAQIHAGVLLGVLGAVITIIALGIVISTSQKSMSIIRTTAENKIANPVNETLTWAGNNSAMSLSRSGLESIVDGSGQLYQNGTVVQMGGGGSPTNNIGNWSANYTLGIIYFRNTSNLSNRMEAAGAPGDPSSLINFSYQYYYGSSERNISKTGQTALDTLSQFQPTFGTIIAVSMVILLVTALAILIYKKME